MQHIRLVSFHLSNTNSKHNGFSLYIHIFIITKKYTYLKTILVLTPSHTLQTIINKYHHFLRHCHHHRHHVVLSHSFLSCWNENTLVGWKNKKMLYYSPSSFFSLLKKRIFHVTEMQLNLKLLLLQQQQHKHKNLYDFVPRSDLYIKHKKRSKIEQFSTQSYYSSKCFCYYQYYCHFKSQSKHFIHFL